MLKKWVVSVAIFAICTIASTATGLPPLHNPSAISQASVVADQVNKQSKIGSQGVVSQPLVVTSPTEKQKEDDDHTTAIWTRYLGMGTFALALIAMFQVLLFRQQLRLMVDGARQAEAVARSAQDSADAAKKSADVAERSLTQLERPYVYGNVRKAGYAIREGDGQGEMVRSDLELVIYNFGRTPAQLTHLEYRISVSPQDIMRDANDCTATPGRRLPIGTISAFQDPFIEVKNCRVTFVAETEGLIEGRLSIWIVGFVRYMDVFYNHHVTGFSQVLDLWTGRFIRCGDERYNYMREEFEDDIPR